MAAGRFCASDAKLALHIFLQSKQGGRILDKTAQQAQFGDGSSLDISGKRAH